MNGTSRLIASHLGTAALFGALAVPAATSSPAGESIPSTWQHRTSQIHYFGVTTVFSCDGIEEKVRRILGYLGARKDMRVQARGCVGVPVAPRNAIVVDADFYVLAPVADASAAATVNAQWSVLALEPVHPDFMSEGDCELIDDMKTLTTQSFSVRGIDYRADCVPHQAIPNSFAVKGEILRILPPKSP
ncbi:MAG: hypothetical protein ACLP0B_19040 [Steroidobacteraceae bacterium]|jgi:hypothetical protein